MFKDNRRYITKGISENVDIRLQIILWGLIDGLKEKFDIELDYLQVFEISEKEGYITIKHY